MSFEYDVHEIHENGLRKALKLVNKVYDEFVAVDYSEKGKRLLEILHAMIL